MWIRYNDNGIVGRGSLKNMLKINNNKFDHIIHITMVDTINE